MKLWRTLPIKIWKNNQALEWIELRAKVYDVRSVFTTDSFFSHDILVFMPLWLFCQTFKLTLRSQTKGVCIDSSLLRLQPQASSYVILSVVSKWLFFFPPVHSVVSGRDLFFLHFDEIIPDERFPFFHFHASSSDEAFPHWNLCFFTGVMCLD